MQRPAIVTLLFLGACGSSKPPPAEPSSTEPAVAEREPPPPVDAAEAIDAPPGPSAELLAAPAWIFRFNAPPRVETWTLRYLAGAAVLEVATAERTTRYLGTATDGPSLVIDVAAPTAAMKLDCKPGSRAVGPTCDGHGATKVTVLDCYVPDFASPMTFAPAPGLEYSAACNGYRRLP